MIVDIICFLFILLFVYAAMSKLLDYQKFIVQLGKSPLLAPFSQLISWFIPVGEISIGVSLVFRKFQLLALYASFSLMVIFSTYIVVILNFSEYIPCSCGGILENMSWKQHLLFNIVFVIFGAWAVLLYPYKNKVIIGQ